MAIGLTIMVMVALGIACVFHLLAILSYKPPPEETNAAVLEDEEHKRPYEVNYIQSIAVQDATSDADNIVYDADKDTGNFMTKL